MGDEITLKLKKRIEEKEYIDENSFIIYEHIKTSKKLIEYNDKHIGIEKCNIDNYFCIKGLELINDINNIIKQLNRCFIEYINDKSIKYENIVLENHFNRKYNDYLDEFAHIYSK